ncbi:hypothetical protein JMG10_01030 [Nostoc ellipsosporum NOK]|jgi:hypothetical protein|nr:hypothetical protein [Nostoc ellipsosporum NOK]
MTKHVTIACMAALLLATSCKSKKERKPEDKNFPILGYLQSEALGLDTSLARFVKTVYYDSTHIDTFYIPRQQVREEAKDFLNIPDIFSSKYEDDYTESRRYDETINKVVMTYTAKEENKQGILKQEVIIQPDQVNGDKVTGIFIDTWKSTKDSTVQKRMLWMVGKNFQITKILQLPGQPEKTTITKVEWNDAP